jgi:hypothetical protein
MNPLKPVKVTRWMSETSSIIYIFDSSENSKVNENEILIKENIYQDDDIEYALNKIAYHISKYDKNVSLPYYAWSKKKPILFDIQKIKWLGYNVNPFKSTDRKSEKLKEPITYKYNHGILEKTFLNIVFYGDFKEKNNYYFTDFKKTSQSFANREKLLNNLYHKEIVYTKLLSDVYNRIDLYDVIELKQSHLSILFDELHATKNIQLIQLVNNNFNPLYKLYKKHKLSSKFLMNVFNLDKISQYNCINMYSVIKNGVYCKITINSNGLITLSYNLDLRNSINWIDMTANKNMIVKYLSNFANKKINLKDSYIKVNIYYQIDNSSFIVLSKKIGEYIDIFHTVKLANEKNKNKITCIYKRSNNYNKDPIDISEYIISRLKLGITEKELIQELINLGINDTEAEAFVMNELKSIKAIDDNKLVRKKIENTGTMLVIERYKQGYKIDISNCASKNELNNILFWLIRIIENTRNVEKKQIQKESIISSFPEIKENSKSESLQDDNIGNIDLDLGSDDDFFKGGALGKNKHGYFMNMLKRADKNLFVNNYSRNKCQAAKQPLVLSKKERDELDKNDMLKYFDNIIEHGSSPSIRNYYACPKIWCPDSKIPLDYNQDEPKCPLENEEPMKLFWDNDKSIPRFAKLTDPDENGLQVPCCFKKDIKKDIKKVDKKDIKKAEQELKSDNVFIDDKDENYIMNKVAPIPIGRYGIVPESLYKILLPNANYSLCSKNLNKVEKCLIRKGVLHKSPEANSRNDSVLYAISYLLGFKSKKNLIKDIIKKLDIVTFLSLENGNVCKDFLDVEPVIPKQNIKICEKFHQFINKDKMFDIQGIECEKQSYKLSRLLNIYKAYNKYINFLATDDYPKDKGIYYLSTLISILYDVLLIVWEKNDDDIRIICPYYASFTDIISTLNINKNSIMILKEGLYYEPLELKLRNTEGSKTFKINNYPNLKQILNECTRLNKYQHIDAKIINDLTVLHQYTKSQIYMKPQDLSFHSIIINDDLTINKFMTKCNVLLKTNPISISQLPQIIKILQIKKIKFYNDIKDKTFDIKLYISDYDALLNNAKKLNIKIDIGGINIQTEEEIYSKLVMPAEKIQSNNIIHYDISNKFTDYIDKEKINSSKWFQLQKMVFKRLIKVYDDDKLKELVKLPRTEVIQQLLKNFSPDIPYRGIIQIILEEIPLYSIDSIKEWFNDIILYNKFEYYYGQIKEYKNEFLFTQNNIKDKIPSKLLSFHSSAPNVNFVDSHLETYNVKEIEDKETKLPSIFAGTPEKLNSKWTKHKKFIWNEMSLLRMNYNKKIIPEFFKWLVSKLEYSFEYDDIINNNKKLYIELITSDNNYIKDLFKDPSFYNEYIRCMNTLNKTSKKFKTLQIFLDTYFKTSTINDRKSILQLVMDSNDLYPNDIDLLSISQLLNISILTIHRAKYGNVEDDVKRGELDDMTASSTLFPANTDIMNRPLVILGKEYEKTHSSYYAITEKNKNIYLQLKETNKIVQMLIENHLKTR